MTLAVLYVVISRFTKSCKKLLQSLAQISVVRILYAVFVRAGHVPFPKWLQLYGYNGHYRGNVVGGGLRQIIGCHRFDSDELGTKLCFTFKTPNLWAK